MIGALAFFVIVLIFNSSKPSITFQYPSVSEHVQKDYTLAFEQSFGFFDDISEREWNLRRTITNGMNHHPLGSDPFQQKGNPAEWYQGNWNPDFSCAFRQAVGGPGGRFEVGVRPASIE